MAPIFPASQLADWRYVPRSAGEMARDAIHLSKLDGPTAPGWLGGGGIVAETRVSAELDWRNYNLDLGARRCCGKKRSRAIKGMASDHVAPRPLHQAVVRKKRTHGPPKVWNPANGICERP